VNPFVGLRPFQDDENHLFFGRGAVVRRIVGKLGAGRFLAVIGPSGSGKSSIVRAGVLPALDAGFLGAGGSSWRFATLRPAGAPLASLASALHDAGLMAQPLEGDRTALIRSVLDRGSLGLSEVVRQSRLPEHESLLVVVDQFEELFRYSGDPAAMDEAAAFVKLLLAASRAASQRVWVMLTMRTDFLGDCVGFRGLAEAISDNQVLIPRMGRRERRQAITGPVAVAGATIAPRLVTTLLNDVGDQPDQLPMLQHALRRTYACWADQGAAGPLDLPHYNAIGTVRGALDQHADQAWGGLPVALQPVAERVFRAVTVTEQGRGVRRPMRLDALVQVVGAPPDQVLAVHQAFCSPTRGFLMPLEGDPGTVDISHESLMRVWSRLKGWVQEEAQHTQLFARLVERSRLHAAGQAGLYTGPELELALEWRGQQAPTPAWIEQQGGAQGPAAMQYLADSEEARDAAVAAVAAAARRKRRVLVLGVALALCVAVAMGLLAIRAEQAKAEAVDLKDKALELKEEAETAEAAALLAEDAAKSAEAEARAAEEVAKTAEEEARAAEEEARAAEEVALKAKDAATRALQGQKRAQEQTRREQTTRYLNQLHAVAERLALSGDPSAAVAFLAEIPADRLTPEAVMLGWKLLENPTAKHAVYRDFEFGDTRLGWAEIGPAGVLWRGGSGRLDDVVAFETRFGVPLWAGWTMGVTQAKVGPRSAALGFQTGDVLEISADPTTATGDRTTTTTLLGGRATTTGRMNLATPLGDQLQTDVTALAWRDSGWTAGAANGQVASWPDGQLTQASTGPVLALDAGTVWTAQGPRDRRGNPVTAPSGPAVGDPFQGGFIVEVGRLTDHAVAVRTDDGTAALMIGGAVAYQTLGCRDLTAQGDTVVVACGRGDSQVWTLQAGQLWDVRPLTSKQEPCPLIAASFQGPELVTVSECGQIRVWDLDQPTVRFPLGPLTDDLVWTDDNTLLVNGVARAPTDIAVGLTSTPLELTSAGDRLFGDGLPAAGVPMLPGWTLSPNGRWLAGPDGTRTRGVLIWVPDAASMHRLLLASDAVCTTELIEAQLGDLAQLDKHSQCP
jgi:energy-coupling factor transporter ATP-binding protein EcfA2